MERGGTEGLRRAKELGDGWRKLDKRETELRNKWWIDGEADPKLLDDWLNAKIDMYQYQLQHSMFDSRLIGKREEIGEKLLYHQKLARGSYHHEKADFCLEIAQSFRMSANDAEKRLKEAEARTDEEIEPFRRLDKELIPSSRNIAANCLHMAANCLAMPEADQGTTSSET